MNLRGCHSSHYIRSIKDGLVKIVHNMDSYGQPGLKFKKVEDIYQNLEAEYNNSVPIIERKTKAGNGYVAEKNEPDCISNESNTEELTLSQFKKRCKRIKRKASESVLLTPKAENDDDIDLTEPLFKFRVKATKISRSKTVPDNRNIPTSSTSKDHTAVLVKVEAPEEVHVSEHGEMTHMVDDSSIFVASESGFIFVNHGAKSRELGSFTNEGEVCELNKVSFDSLDNIKNMELDIEENVTIDDDSFPIDPTTTSDCSQSQLYFQQTPEQVNYISGVQDSDSDSMIDSLTLMSDYLCLPSTSHIWPTPDDRDENVVYMEAKSSISNEKQHLVSVHTDADANSFDFDNSSVVSKDMSFGPDSDSITDSPTLMTDNLCLISRSHIWPTSDDHDEDVVSMEPKSSIYNEKQHLTSVHTDADANSFDFDNNSVVSKDMSFGQDSDSIIDSPTLMSDYLCLPSTSHIWPISDDHDEDVVSMEAKSSISNEKQHLASVRTDADANSFDFDNNSVVSKDTSFGQDSESIIDSPTPMPDYLCLPLKSHIWLTPDGRDEDIVSMEAKSSISNEKQHLTSMNTDADANSFKSDNNSFVSKDISILQEQPSVVPANSYSEVNLDLNNQTDVSAVRNLMGIRQPERLPLTRKVISPNSQEKLCQAMKSAESLDDMDHYKCKEKLYFGEQAENKFTSNKVDADDNEPNVHPQGPQQIENKVTISPKRVLKRPKSYKKNSPTNKCVATKGSLDGPRLCRSLPRLSTGCTSIAGCSESAIAFSQRQMHDIETLASKLMSELHSMKSIVEEKMLYEAYRSPSLKNEADEVKSAIKSATKTGETAKKWLSMMARDCNRFCKIMKLNEDDNTSASALDADPVSGNTNQDKPLQKERKRISFADEAGGTLCDIKVFQIERDSSEFNEMPQPSIV